MSHKCDSTEDWWEIIKSNPQQHTRLFSRDKNTYFRRELIVWIHRVNTAAVVAVHPKGMASSCRPWLCNKIMNYGSYSEKKPYEYQRVKESIKSPWRHHIPALWQQFNFQTVISDHGSYLGRCILQVEIPQSPGRQDFSVSSTFAAPLWIYPPLNRYLLITWDTLNQQGTQHIQQSGGGEKRNANKSQSYSFRSLLCMSSFQRAVCAKLPCGGQPSIWRRSEAWSWSRGHLPIPAVIGQDVSPPTVRGLFL